MNLISGLYNLMKENKSTNEMENIINTLVNFIKRNPDLTNDDIKLLASTDEKKKRYIMYLFTKYPDLVQEVKANDNKNLINLLQSTTNNDVIIDNYARALQKTISNVCSSDPESISLADNYYRMHIKKEKRKLIITKSWRFPSGSSGVSIDEYSKLTVKDIKQIIGLTQFCKNNVIDDKLLESVILHPHYDFTTLTKIIKCKEFNYKDYISSTYGAMELISRSRQYLSSGRIL